jgi:X-Pro dipeptidyl-peptidase
MRWTPCERVEQTLHGYDTEPDYDAFWKQRDYLRLAHKVKVPVLVAHGLLDFNVKTWEGTSWFQALDTEKAMVLGQWPHANPRSYWSEWDFLLERWLERWLYGVRNGVENEPEVHVQTNDKQWHSQEGWGDGSLKAFGVKGKEFSYLDDGSLTESEMLRVGRNAERFVRVEVPGTSGLRIQGRPVLRLNASASQTSTHFVAVLLDVSKTGQTQVISRAFMNGRYRDGLTKGKDLVPGRGYTFDLEFIDKDWVVARDHHLELVIASSSNSWVFPDEQRSDNVLFLKNSSLLLPVH